MRDQSSNMLLPSQNQQAGVNVKQSEKNFLNETIQIEGSITNPMSKTKGKDWPS